MFRIIFTEHRRTVLSLYTPFVLSCLSEVLRARFSLGYLRRTHIVVLGRLELVQHGRSEGPRNRVDPEHLRRRQYKRCRNNRCHPVFTGGILQEQSAFPESSG